MTDAAPLPPDAAALRSPHSRLDKLQRRPPPAVVPQPSFERLILQEHLRESGLDVHNVSLEFTLRGRLPECQRPTPNVSRLEC